MIDQAIIIPFQTGISQHMSQQTNIIKQIQILQTNFPRQIKLQQPGQLLHVLTRNPDRTLDLTRAKRSLSIPIPILTRLYITVNQIGDRLMPVKSFLRGLQNLSSNPPYLGNIGNLQKIVSPFLLAHPFSKRSRYQKTAFRQPNQETVFFTQQQSVTLIPFPQVLHGHLIQFLPNRKL